MHNKVKDTAFLGLCIALALGLAYIEVLLPPLFAAVPGIKMGLPNIILIFLLYRRGFPAAATVSLLRMVLVTLLFGNFMAFAYSLAGGALSMAVMVLLKKLNFLSTTGVSVAGGVTHNVGQILMAMWLMNTAELGYYLIVLAVTGTIAGLLIGLCGSLLIRRIPHKW
ncbi:MAG: Gx transporter family protein [Clostridia bacterium]|nr:Gx transporter family protein [Clostridia bacterium]